MADDLTFDVTARDKASDVLKKVGTESSETAVKVDAANIRVEKSTAALATAQQKYGAESLQARDAANKLASAQIGAAKAMSTTADAADDATEGVGNLKGAFGLLAAGVATAGLGAAFQKSLDIKAANKQLQAQLGATPAEAARYGKEAGQLYSNNFGDSIENVNDAIKNVVQNIGKLGDSGSNSLESVTGKVLSLSQAFDVDLFDSTKAVGTLIRSGLAKDATEALDLITYGLQKIPGAQEDLIDTLTEYDVQFAALGITGPEAIGFIASAMQNGARNTDLAADALKEFNLRSKDTTNTGAVAALSELGFAADTTAHQIAGGGSSAAQALSDVLGKLEAVKDPADRARLATALFGTQAEDLQAALLKVDPKVLTQGLDETAGSAQALSDTLGDTANAKIETYRRKLEQLVVNAVSLPGALGGAAAAGAAFGGDILTAGANTAQLASGLALVPGVADKVTAALKRVKVAGLLLAPLGAIVGTVFAVGGIERYIASTQVGTVKTDVLARSLQNLAENGKLTQDSFALFDRGFGPFTSHVDTSNDALFRFGHTAAAALQDGLGANLNRIASFNSESETLKKTTSQLDDSFVALVQGGHVDAATEAQKKFVDAAIALGTPVDKANALFPKFNDALAANAAQEKDAAAQAKLLGQGYDETGKSAANSAVSQEDLNKAIQKYSSEALTARGDARSFQAALDEATKSIKENGKTLDITTEKGRANQSALDDIAESGLKLAQDTPKGADAQTYFAKTLETTRARLITTAEKMGATKAEAKKLADQILGVPVLAKTTISTPGMTNAIKYANELHHDIDGIPKSKSVTVTTYFYQVGKEPGTYGNGLGVKAPGKAVGGPVQKGQPYIVGEHRPELFVPNVNGTIIPSVPAAGEGYTARQPTGKLAGGGVASVQLEVVSAGGDLNDLLVQVIRKAVRVNGGNVQQALGRN